GDFTNYKTLGFITDNITIRNNIVQINPAIGYFKPLLNVHAGITPVWYNGKFSLLPDIYFEAQVQEKIFMLQGGWIGKYSYNNYSRLTAVNPYLLPVTSQVHTKETEIFGGIKATLGSHFNINAKAGFITYKNLPLFINDTATDSKGFITSYEPEMHNLRLHGDVSYIRQEEFTLNAGFTLNGYTGMQVNRKAWHTIPLEVNGSLRWLGFRRLVLKSDLYVFNGGNALEKGNNNVSLPGGFDLSAGAEYKVNKQFSAWIDVNNLLNDKYERWHNYPVYGLNILGGIIIRF
ncbi:MAG: hypothetical protein ABIP80_00205, partial [Ferruginibacter sp.]